MSTVNIPDGHPSFDKLTLKDTTLTGTTVFPNGAKIQIGNNPASGTIATTAFVNRKIGDLVANAPATLDTLKELATSFGDLPNFKGYVDGGLDLKAPLASPTFTGTPAAPTATSGTATTQIATTAFVSTAVAAEATARGTAIAAEATARGTAITNAVAAEATAR